MGSCWGYFLGTQFVTLDMTLTAFMTGAMCAFLVAQDARTDARSRRRFMLLAWVLCALGVLTKGDHCRRIADTCGRGLRRRHARLRRCCEGCTSAPARCCSLAIAAPWFVLVELRNPGFADFFFIHEHLLRYVQPVHRRTGPWWYFIPVSIVFLMPWLPALIAAMWHERPVRAMRSLLAYSTPQRFAWCYAAAIFVFFSLSSSKLPAYIMPAIGAVALGAAMPLARRFDASSASRRAHARGRGSPHREPRVVPAARFIKVPMVREDFVTGTPWIMVGVIALVAGGLPALRFQKRGFRLRALAAIVLSSLIACQCGGRACRAYRRVFLVRAPDRAADGARATGRSVPRCRSTASTRSTTPCRSTSGAL